ncbi:hypothetical protein dinky_179 [Salmonella phage dinky]|uniref:Uncharacterized protein n=2 Tax=Kuttervirus TaxID=2169536 RepID=A0A6G8RNN2_9CAUD|nr:hypothetical protein HYQ33_gp183 [Salmonella phage aagejoakim]YP_009888501.1 hypothetical protein HYQ34_gp179 [Salmonella phage dinky]QIO02781.1 hypothetical protein aagejoakim_183 [Salmonella phage aagejoakim]QIO02983.1 hypothetical protein dinky_179 [Salmonella phage dinky]
MALKLTESLTLDQQQALLDEVVISAVKQGIIRDDTLLTRPEMIHHLVVCLGEANNPRKKIRMFKGGVIYPNGRFAFLEPVLKSDGTPNNDGYHIKTSVPVTPYTEGVDELSWFETINTIYIMSPDGKPVQDLRGDKVESKD